MGYESIKKPAKFVAALCLLFTAFAITACPPSKTPEQMAEEHFQKGKTYWQQDKFKEAIEEWEKATEVYPQHVQAHYQLGLAYSLVAGVFLEDNDYDTAQNFFRLSINHLEKVQSLTPNDPEIYNTMGLVYSLMQNYDRSIEYYRQAIMLKPYEADYHYNIGNAYAGKDMFKQAIEEYKETIRLDAGYFDAYYMIGSVYEDVNDVNNAIKYYQEYVNRENRTDYADRVQKTQQRIYKLRGGPIF